MSQNHRILIIDHSLLEKSCIVFFISVKTFESMASKGALVFKALRVYWKTLFVIIYPLVLLPVFLCNNTPALRCLYIVLLMAGYWVFEALPLPVTSLIPMVLFPLMGVLDSDKTSLCYLKETNMMFVGGLVIAIAVEYCNLHTRVALHVIKLIGCSPRKLNIGLVTVTMFVSMWISNTAATAMMIPIIEATLEELERQGIGEMYESDDLDGEKKEEQIEPEGKRPTKQTMCYFISTAYAANIGGIGCVIGSGTNLTFKGLYETLFPDSPGWPNCVDAKKIRVGTQGESVARKLIVQKIEDMGPMSFHEIAVGLCFILSIFLWFFRKPQFIAGWAELITEHK
ncbi:hypothetical protein NQ314_011163, partial [Rhamnusium bicolor]